MSKNTQTATAPAFVLAQVSLETSQQFTKAIVSAMSSNATALAKADRDLLGNTSKAARLIAVTLTEAQWSKQFASGVRKGLEAKGLVDVSGALSRAKIVTLSVNSGDAALQPLAGETINTFCTRVRPLLAEAKLPSGDWIMTREADGTPKAKAGAKAGAKKPAKSAGDATNQEGGDNAPAKLRAAQILLGQGEAANQLMIVAEQHAERLAKFLADLLKAEADNAVTRAKERKAA
jgi:hypothetical protein